MEKKLPLKTKFEIFRKDREKIKDRMNARQSEIYLNCEIEKKCLKFKLMRKHRR